MKPSRIINNLTGVGVGLGFVFPIGSLLFDLYIKDHPFTFNAIGQLYTDNPLHWIILSAPIVLGASFYYLGKRIASRELFLHSLAENEKKQIRLIENYINELGTGNLNAELSEDFTNDSLEGVLHTFRDKLKSDREADEHRRWVNEGIARIGDVLRQHENISDLSYAVIKNLVDYCGCNQGGIFIVHQDDDDKVTLELEGCYAYERKKFLERTVDPGEGLVGQCYLEKEPILLYKVPNNYLHITSGLGLANPTCLVLFPLKTDDSIEGVVEIAGFKRLGDHEMDFLKRVCESTATVIKNVRSAEKTKQLLAASQEQAEMMRSQEEEMRQNMEELAATQEEMQRKEQEFIRQIEDYKAKLGA